jgi:dihydropyrimidinase
VTLLIKNGTVVSPTGAYAADVLIDGEQIVGLLQPGAIRDQELSAAEDVFDFVEEAFVPGAASRTASEWSL